MAEKKDTESARIGAILARQRAALQLDQGEIARTLGVSPVTVGRWERGLSKPELWRRADVESAYKLPLGAVGGVTLHNTGVPRETLVPAAVREPAFGYGGQPPTDTPSAALYWAMAEVQEALVRISREAARLATENPKRSKSTR